MADGGRPGSTVRGLAAATGTGDGAGARGAPATVGVVGCGLLGTSVALRLAEAGLEPLLADADEAAVATAVRLGAGHPWTDGTTAGLAVVAVPPLAAGRVARELLASGRAALATDVASVKRVVQADVDADPSVCTRFCGGHPMAGRERGGALRARPDLFEGRPWVVTPTRTTSRAARDAVAWLAATCGAVPVKTDGPAHDRAVALVSHLPQLVASLLAARLLDAGDDALRLAGQGLRDTVRVAGSDPSLWAAIVGANADVVAPLLREVREELDGLLGVMDERGPGEGPDPGVVAGAVSDLVARGRLGRERLPGKHGAPPRQLAEVSVVVDDRVGGLAALFAAARDTGVNVEDLRIDHAPGRAAGVVDLLVAPEGAPRLADGLRGAGWTVAAAAGPS